MSTQLVDAKIQEGRPQTGARKSAAAVDAALWSLAERLVTSLDREEPAEPSSAVPFDLPAGSREPHQAAEPDFFEGNPSSVHSHPENLEPIHLLAMPAESPMFVEELPTVKAAKSRPVGLPSIGKLRGNRKPPAKSNAGFISEKSPARPTVSAREPAAKIGPSAENRPAISPAPNPQMPIPAVNHSPSIRAEIAQPNGPKNETPVSVKPTFENPAPIAPPSPPRIGFSILLRKRNQETQRNSVQELASDPPESESATDETAKSVPAWQPPSPSSTLAAPPAIPGLDDDDSLAGAAEANHRKSLWGLSIIAWGGLIVGFFSLAGLALLVTNWN